MRAALALTESRLPEASPASPATVAQPAQKSLLRFITCGSVDDGKSTLLGRLLWETNSVFEDQAEALARDSEKFGTTGKAIDYALLVDGLSAEREQGITIDVAYRYFSTLRRSFIAADTPGHEQYTRNMATGASTADCAIILIDARKGLLPQTRRHSYIVSMLGVRSVIVAVNKMDLVGYSEETFRRIEADYRALVPALGFTEVHVVPLAAREGDNLSSLSPRMRWYRGATLLDLLETIEAPLRQDARFRLPVQWVNRPDAEFRGYSGTIAGGEIRVGDPVTVLPRGQESRIARILTPQGEAQAAGAGEAVTVTLGHEIDVSRGDVIVSTGSGLKPTRRMTARLLGLADAGIEPGRTYLLKLGTGLVRTRVSMIHYGVNIEDYVETPSARIALNGIGLATLEVETEIHATRYSECAALGSLLLIDPINNETLALGTIDQVVLPAAPDTAGTSPHVVETLVRLLVPADATTPEARSRHLSWRLASALLVALPVGLVTGSAGLGLAAAIGDVLLRTLGRAGHDRLWRAIGALRRRRAQDTLGLDGGGI